MRVTFNHNEISHGLFRKTTYYNVHCKVEFSEEEKAIIKARNLDEYIVFECPHHANNKLDEQMLRILGPTLKATIGKLLKDGGTGRVCANPVEAKQYERDLTEALKTLKTFIMANAEIEEKATCFEL